MDWSLILPSRERPGMLGKLLESIERTTHELDNLEVWVAVDTDDTLTMEKIGFFTRRYRFARFLVTDRQKNFSTGYYNRLAGISQGRFIQTLNDDCVFTTEGWDRLALQILEEYQYDRPDGILLGKCEDSLRLEYPCFPVISRQSFDTFGLFHPEFPTWGVDMWLYKVFNCADRVVWLPYLVEHYCHHNKTREQDHVNKRAQKLARYNWGSIPGECQRLKGILASKAPPMPPEEKCMTRPCYCNNFVFGQPHAEGQCRPCWLFHHEERYFREWGGTGEMPSSPIPAPTPVAAEEPKKGGCRCQQSQGRLR